MQNSNLEVAESTVERNAAPCSESAVNNAITNSAPAPTVDQEKLRLIQKQLVLLLHAYACRRKDCQSGWASTLCSLPNCATMKHVPSHMKVCKIGKQCTLPHCVYYSQNISHWRNCTANYCPVCVPLQEAARTQQASTVQVTQSNQELGLAKNSKTRAVNTVTEAAITNSAPAPTTDQRKHKLMQLQLLRLLQAYECRSNDNQSSLESAPADQRKHKLIQLQLLRLLHAYDCRRNDVQSCGESTPCSLPNCATMKHVLSHMTTCQNGKQCTVPHCVSYGQIISHWRKCTAHNCPVCVPLKQTAARRQQRDPDLTIQTKRKLLLEDIQRDTGLGLKLGTANDGIGLNAVEQVDPLISNQVVQSCSLQNLNHIQAFQPGQQNTPRSPLQMESMLQNNAVSFPNAKTSNVINENFPSKLAAPSADLLSSPNKKNRIPNLITDNSVPVKDWPFNMDTRHYVVQKMIQSLFPAVNSNMLKDHRLAGLVSLVERVERDTYNNANSKQEYCRLLAEILLKMQKILKDKRQNDKENRLSKQRGN
ncbi:histone acetyltransferase [Caerostris darwini]|uniref:histone acetyltransferase n=1 Tax=Caerostris darwini TaxID=1538125 RepID=A0AAV4WQI1_9ARAC|nr:histone acetyltransferase [Caerostris darwini]